MPTDCIIQKHMSLTELYGHVLQMRREIEVADRKGTSICRTCKAAKSKHLPDGRCSSSAVSRTFMDDRHEEAAKLERALLLIEELTEIN